MDYYLKTIQRYEPLTFEEEQELFPLAKAGNKRAKETLINSNLRFVVSVAKYYQNQGLTLEELIAEGNVGLVKAYNKFIYEKRFKFITYAVWWIRQSVMSAIHEHSKLIRLPINKITNITKIAKATEALEARLGRSPTSIELSEHLGDPRVLADAFYQYTMIGLDTPYTDNKKNLNNVLASEPTTADLLEAQSEFKEELDEILKEFTVRDKDVIYMYFGIGHIRPYTLKEIGYDLGLTRERIRQIKQKIIEKLQRKPRADRLRGYLEWVDTQ